MSIGTPEINVPNTGINPQINTMSASVKINGKATHPWTKLMMRSHRVVSTALVRAMID